MSRGNKRITRGRENLEEQLAVQIGFLRTSCRLYDEGDRAEAKRLANALRILLYDLKQSRSLLGQLGMLGLRFTNTNLRFNPHNLLGHQGLLVLHLAMEEQKVTGDFEPRVIARPGIVVGEMPFSHWWEHDPILVDQDRNRVTRRDVVLFVANQDGGAHVDPALDAAYDALQRGESLGWRMQTPNGQVLIADPASPCLRQIAHEVLETLNDPRQVSPFASEATRYPKYPEDSRAKSRSGQ